MASPSVANMSKPQNFEQISFMHQSIKLTTIDLVGGIKCNICQSIFGNKKDYDNHYGTHYTGSPTIVYTCVICDKEEPEYPRFRNHCYLKHVNKDKFKCETCSKLFSKLSSLQKHIDSVHKFSCSTCTKQFPTKKELLMHQIVHKNEGPPFDCQACGQDISNIDDCERHIEEHCILTYTCPICNENILNKSDKTEHLIKHFGQVTDDPIPDTEMTIPDDSSIDTMGGILCCYCESMFKTRFEFDAHFPEQHPGKDIVYSCNICGKQYSKYVLFGDHCYYHYSKDKFECEDCDKSFSRLSLLVIHTEAFHCGAEVDKPYKCTQCDRSFKSERRHRLHMRDYHDVHSLTCHEEGCGIKFDTPKDLILHQSLHKSSNRCQQCGLQFTSLAACERHIHVHRKKAYSCPVCGRNYGEKYLVMKHAQQHFSTALHLCKMCGKVYNAKSRLVQHIKTHSEIRKHTCSYCGKGFVKMYQLSQHLNIHTGLKPFRCSECPKTFASQPNLAKHVQRMHNNIKKIPKQAADVNGENNKIFTPNSELVNTNNSNTDNNNVLVKNDSLMDSTSSEMSADAYMFMLDESDDSVLESDIFDTAGMNQSTQMCTPPVDLNSCDMAELTGPLPVDNITPVPETTTEAQLCSESSWLPPEYGPDFVNKDSLDACSGQFIDLDDHIMPHIDPLLTIKNQSDNVYDTLQNYNYEHYDQNISEPNGYDMKWEPPIFTKVYQEYPCSYGEMADGNRLSVMNTDIY